MKTPNRKAINARHAAYRKAPEPRATAAPQNARPAYRRAFFSCMQFSNDALGEEIAGRPV